MKITFLKNIMLGALCAAGLTLVSCNGNKSQEGEMTPETENMSPEDRDGASFEENEMDTEEDTITKINRETKDFDVNEQVP